MEGTKHRTTRRAMRRGRQNPPSDSPPVNNSVAMDGLRKTRHGQLQTRRGCAVPRGAHSHVPREEPRQRRQKMNKTAFISTLPKDEQDKIRAALTAQGYSTEDIELAMNSRLCDVLECMG